MQVKICGIQTIDAARTACESGADFLGFVFAESRRKVSPEIAARIISQLPKQIQTVGVFVNETKEKMIEIAETAQLDYIQLHGSESPSFCQQLGLPVIKAFSIKQAADLQQVKDYDCAYYLFDSPGVKYAGGSGIPFDWDLLQDLAIPREQLILAGGLSSENVQTAIEQVRPAVVDVSSGVETNGEKDLLKISQFIETVNATSLRT